MPIRLPLVSACDKQSSFTAQLFPQELRCPDDIRIELALCPAAFDFCLVISLHLPAAQGALDAETEPSVKRVGRTRFFRAALLKFPAIHFFAHCVLHLDFFNSMPGPVKRLTLACPLSLFPQERSVPEASIRTACIIYSK